MLTVDAGGQLSLHMLVPHWRSVFTFHCSSQPQPFLSWRHQEPIHDGTEIWEVSEVAVQNWSLIFFQPLGRASVQVMGPQTPTSAPPHISPFHSSPPPTPAHPFDIVLSLCSLVPTPSPWSPAHSSSYFQWDDHPHLEYLMGETCRCSGAYF